MKCALATSSKFTYTEKILQSKLRKNYYYRENAAEGSHWMTRQELSYLWQCPGASIPLHSQLQVTKWLFSASSALATSLHIIKLLMCLQSACVSEWARNCCSICVDRQCKTTKDTYMRYKEDHGRNGEVPVKFEGGLLELYNHMKSWLFRTTHIIRTFNRALQTICLKLNSLGYFLPWVCMWLLAICTWTRENDRKITVEREWVVLQLQS